jgi:cysteine desulfurase
MIMNERLYLDHAATTPLWPGVIDALHEAMTIWANPSSPHAHGRAVRAKLEAARARIKSALGWPHELIFTSGASEALGLALSTSPHIGATLISAAEHPAVHRHAPHAALLALDSQGLVTPESLSTQLEALGSHKALVAIQHMNNETGVVQDIERLVEIVHDFGGLICVDCAQSATKLPLPLNADFITISAHKFGGPPGIGALLVRDLRNLRASGGQEQGYRMGTENFPAIMGMAAALEQDTAWLANAAHLRTTLDAAILAHGGGIIAANAPRFPTVSSYVMPNVTAQVQLIRFDMAGISVSAGSACSSGSIKPSPTLLAMGYSEHEANEVIRVSIGHDTSPQDIAQFIAAWVQIKS